MAKKAAEVALEQALQGAMVAAVYVEEIDERPQLVLVIVHPATGFEHHLLLDRELARDLPKKWGPHELVEEFYSGGKGLQ
jgi:hypothetical protein